MGRHPSRSSIVALWVAAVWIAPLPAEADLTGVPSLDPALLCDAAIAQAEQGHDLPPHLLGAIGRVESGRRDPISGMLAPWPWTVDVDGQGHLYSTEAQAIAAVQQARAGGHTSIDVGCMQANLAQHPNAFASLTAAFDPVTNAAYAVRFLTELRDAAPDWMTAAGLYHSATPGLAAEYRGKVAAMMEQDGGAPMLATAMPFAMPIPPAGGQGSGVRGMTMRTASALSVPTSAGRDLASYRAMPVRRRG